MYDYSPENIVALATPPGRGALAIVRLSGSDLCSTYRSFSKKKPIDRRAVYSKIYHPNSNRLLDEAIITYFKSPNSFTGEDVIEISCHGGGVVPHSIVLAAIDSGARNASPGEFSLRAFLNGKIDLLQAEAVASLISSKSQFGADVCLHHLQGRVSNILSNIRTDAIEVLGIIENELNFSEDEIDFISYNQMRKVVVRIQKKISSILEASTFGKDIFSGIRVVIIGKPNSGKSSLFNALLGFDRAIVSNIPGTTRDTVEASIDLEGFPVCLIDTAGIWESDNILDDLGVQKTMGALNQADICILVDDDDPCALIKSHFTQSFLDSCILVKSKCDNLNSKKQTDNNILHLSSKKGHGIDKLLTYISTYITENISRPVPLEHMLITRRQRKLLEVSLDSINRAYKQILSRVETDIIASSLNGFVITIGDVVGEVPTKEVLNHIFDNFCVGK